MKKNGQVTLYVILGMVIVIIASLFLYFSSSISDSLKEREVHQEKIRPIEKESISLFVSECLANVTSNVVNNIYLQGGYANIPQELLVQYSVFNFTCYCCSSSCTNAFLQNLKIEQQIASSIETSTEFYSCIQNFSLFEGKRGERIEAGSLKVNATILNHEIVVKADYPLEIIKGDVVEKVNEFAVIDRRNLGEILESAREHINQYMNGESFSSGMHAAQSNDIKIEGQFFNKDYELFSYSSLEDDSQKFFFVLYEPLGGVGKISSSCCIEQGKCYEHAQCENPLGRSCSEVEECRTAEKIIVPFEARGCCKTESGIQRTITEECTLLNGIYYTESCTALGFCEKTDQRVCGNDNALYQLDSCGNFDEKVKQCIAGKELCTVNEGVTDCLETSCTFTLNDKNGVRDITLENGKSVCSQREGVGMQHERIFCENSVLAKEGFGFERESICEDLNESAMRIDNQYETCSSCGSPNSNQDLLLFVQQGNGYRCTAEQCISLGHCTPVQISLGNAKIGNIDCMPTYPVGNSNACQQCGNGEDKGANLCNKEECEMLGNCKAEELATKETLNLIEAAVCLADIALASIFESSVSCPADIWKIYNLIGYNFSLKEYPKPVVHESKCSPANYDENSNCAKCMDEVICTPEICSQHGEDCVFQLKNGVGSCNEEKINRDGKFEIKIISPSPSLVKWDKESVDLEVETNEETTCKYSWNIIVPWEDMVTIQDQNYKNLHLDSLFISPAIFTEEENERLFIITCMDKDGKRKTVTHSIQVGEKGENEKPLIVANIQGKQPPSLGKSLQIISDKEVSCKYNNFKVGNANRDTILGSLPVNAFDVCEFVTEKQRTFCEKDLQGLSNGTYIFTVQCADKSGISSDLLPVTFLV